MKITFGEWMMVWLLVGLIDCESYFFQRFIECQNNDFQIVPQMDGNEILLDEAKGSQSAKLGQNNLPQLELSEQLPEKNSQRLEGEVRCKKWIQSYKLYKKTNLRSDNHPVQQNQLNQLKSQQNQLKNQINPKRKLITYRHAAEILHQTSDEMIEEAAGSNKSGNQKVKAALFTLINAMQAITIYQG